MYQAISLRLIAATAIVILLGLLIHYSLAPQNIGIHLAFVALGIIGFIVISRFDLKILPPFSWHLFFLALGLLATTLIIGDLSHGSTRWLEFGSFRFQPSEIAKLLLILSFPSIIEKLRISSFLQLVKALLLLALPTALIFLQPDFGSAVVFFCIGAVMIFYSGMRWRHILILILITTLISPIIWLSLKDYQQARIHTFLDPTADPLGKGYNANQAVIAVGSGQLLGRGLGHGTQSKLKFLPEYETDFAFASLAEELGLVGSFLLLGSYGVILWELLALAKIASDNYSYLCIIGTTTMFAVQVFINLGMNIGLLPITGITLPLISYGGTSIIISLVSLGVALNLTAKGHSYSEIEITAL